MNLFFTDDAGNRILIAEDVRDESDALLKMVEHQRRRHIYQSGKIAIKKMPKQVTFTNAAGVDTGYTLEQ